MMRTPKTERDPRQGPAPECESKRIGAEDSTSSQQINNLTRVALIAVSDLVRDLEERDGVDLSGVRLAILSELAEIRRVAP